MAQPRPSYFQNRKRDLDPDAVEALQKDSQPAETPALSKVTQMHNNNNNAGNCRGLRGSVSLSPFATKVTHKLSYVERVVLEIVETERMYVRDLRSIVEDYLGEIIDTLELPIRPEQVSDLFGNIEDIYELNSELLQDLDSCDNDPVAVARCFVEKSQDFDVYTQYCTNYPNSVAALTECMRSKLLAKFFRERQEMLKHSLPLGSYLLKPVQRILKYHLLLQEIAKHFDVEEEGYEVVEEAIDTMTGVAWYINDMKRKHEHAVRLQEIQSLLLNWKGLDLTTYGELVLEGTFRIQRARNERTLFLFYKALFITKKRGDHFVYKTHIPCSSLMLIESTRESLCFSLTHYKNSKQQYNIQVRTSEEKRLWTHHIKTLILENHHAIIPQKAKEAILEMDALYPGRYKYSPERVKKAMTIEDSTVQARQGRRLSEPSKHILKHLGDKAVLKHADSVGALLDIGNSFQPSGGCQVSSLGQSETPQEDMVKELSLKKDSPEHLDLSDTSGKDNGAGLTASDDDDEEEEEEEEEEDILMGDDQIKETREMELPKECKRQKSQSSDIPEKHESVDVLSADKASAEFEPIDVQEESPHERQHPEEISSDVKPAHPQEPTVITQMEGIESSHCADIHDPVGHSESENVEDLKAFSSEDEEEEGTIQEPESILPPSVLDQASIIAERFLNSLSRRSSLALDDGKFIGCLSPRLTSRSGSTMSLDCNEKPQYHTSSSELRNCFSPREIPIDLGMVVSSCFSPLNGTGSPSLESPIDADRSMIKRKDSTLSKQDRLLLDKIKHYYDHAENHDAAFSIKRRESLSYIPTGVVRNSVFKFNSLPRSESKLETTGRDRINSSSSTGGSRPASWAQPDVHIPTSNDEIKSYVSYPEENVGLPRSDNPKDQLPITDGEFKSPSVMFKVWEEMEKIHRNNMTESHGTFNEGDRGRANITLVDEQNRDSFSRNDNGFDLHEPLLILEDSDLSTITEESSAPSPESTSPYQAVPERHPYDANYYGQDFKIDQPIKLHPKFLQLAQSIDGDITEKMKNKVYQLARKYSQRIKCNKPVVQRRLRELEEDLRRNCLPSVQEEKQMDDKGKLKPALLSLPTYDHVLIQEHSSLTPVSACSSLEKSPQRFSFSPSCTSPGIACPSKSGCRSPLSPVVVEKFPWPDVRELRSKYSSKPGTGKVKSPPVNRSQSVPDNIAAHYPENPLTVQNFEQKEQIGRSYSMNIGQRANSTHQTSKQVALRSNVKTETDTKLSGPASLNSSHGGFPSEVLQANRNQYHRTDESYYVSAEAPLENNKKVVIMERLHNVDLLDSHEKEVSSLETDDSYVQIRSPTSREKICLKAVAERCKAYQESEEYRKRQAIQVDDAKEQTSTNITPDPRGTSLQFLWEKSDQNQQSCVKDLRKKFQTLGSKS